MFFSKFNDSRPFINFRAKFVKIIMTCLQIYILNTFLHVLHSKAFSTLILFITSKLCTKVGLLEGTFFNIGAYYFKVEK